MNHKQKLICLVSLMTAYCFWGNLKGIQAQNAPVTTIATVANAVAGQQVVVPITVVGFNSIGAFSLSVDYDITKLQYVSGTQNPLLSGVFNMGDNNMGSNIHRIVMGWFSSGVSMPDGSWLVNLTFIYLSGSPTLDWFEMGPSCEYSDQAANPLNDLPTSNYFINGRVCGALSNPGQVTGNNNICQGATGVSYAVAPIADVTGYTWSVPSGVTIVSGINSNSISVDYSMSAVSGNISVSGMNECGNGPVSNLPVTVNALPLANAGNDTTISYGTAIQLHAASGGTGTFSYHWSPENLLVNPDLQNPMTVSLTTNTLFVLEVTNTSGQCQSIDELAITVIIEMLSAIPTVVPGAICYEQSAQLFANVSGGLGVYTYSWTSVPPGTPTWSSTLPNPFVSPDTTTQYLLEVNDGVTSINGSTNLVVYQLPAAQLSGGGTICNDGSQATISVDLAGTPPWSFIITNGISSNTFNSIYTSPYLVFANEPGIYSIISVQDMNCFGNSAGTAEVIVNPVPPAPAINYIGTNLASNTPDGNQWYFNGQLIPGAIEQSYIPVYNGQYFDIVTANGCSSDTSNILDILITGTKFMDGNSILLFPNPAIDHVIIKGSQLKGIALNLTLFSGNGAIIYSRSYVTGEIENEIYINTSNYTPGVYLLKIDSVDSVHSQKMLVIRE